MQSSQLDKTKASLAKVGESVTAETIQEVSAFAQTDMFYASGAVKGPEVISPAESARKQLELYSKLTKKDSGKFLSYIGEVLPY